MRWLITGGCGFIGGHVVDKLVDLGHEVVYVDEVLSIDGYRKLAGRHPCWGSIHHADAAVSSYTTRIVPPRLGSPAPSASPRAGSSRAR